MREACVLLLFLLQLFATNSAENVENLEFRLTSNTSHVQLNNAGWTIGEDEVLSISVLVKLETFDGTILSASLIDKEDNIDYTLTIGLNNKQLSINFLNNESQSLLSKPFSQTTIANKEEHRISVKIDNKAQTLIYVVSENKNMTDPTFAPAEYMCEVTDHLNFKKHHLRLVIGNADRSAIGCVKVDSVQTDKEVILADTQNTNEERVGECGEDSRCKDIDCGEGKCLALEVPTCNCFGTAKTGPNCRKEPKTISLDSDADESVLFTPAIGDPTPAHISLDFKLSEQQRDGVLLYAKLKRGGPLVLSVVDSKGMLKIGETAGTNFTMGQIDGFHYIQVKLDRAADGEVWLKVDGADFPVKWVSVEGELEIQSVRLGQAEPISEPTGTAIGFSGCMRNIYVDHMDLLFLYDNSDPRVATSRTLRECDSHTVGVHKLLVGDVIGGHGHGINPVPTDPIVAFVPKDPAVADMYPAAARGPKFHDGTRCENAISMRCLHGSKCEMLNDDINCVCREGYTGKYCQFSLLPQTCEEARTLLKLPAGPTRIDVDGSGPLSESVVMCNENGDMIIPHDMPNRTVIKNGEIKPHALFKLSYRDMSERKLARLIQISDNCKQKMDYTCDHAPLGFATGRTWFQVASNNATSYGIGDENYKCECDTKGGCRSGRACNCDAGGPSSDTGTFTGIHSAVTSITALTSPTIGKAEATLGPLVCHGNKGSAVRFSGPAEIKTVPWKGGHFSFHFRTGQSSATLAYAMKTEAEMLSVELVDGHRVYVVLKHPEGEIERVTLVDTQHKLNDTRWHIVVVEISNGELRLTVDFATTVITVNEDHIPKETFVINDRLKGFIGCVKAVVVDYTPTDLKTFLPAEFAEHANLGCDSLCDNLQCQNEAVCMEEFTDLTAHCICKYPLLHSGQTCDVDINKNSAVSFHGGFLRYDGISGALTEQVIMSVRTDQPNALVYFAHDQNYNFVQVHISEEINITLTLNNADEVFSCTVRADHGKEFSNMEWIQLFLTHKEDGSTLTVEESSCTIHHKRELATVPIKVFHHATTEFVTMPVGVQKSVSSDPFIYTFIGGVERGEHHPTENKRLLPIYTFSVGDLLGCVRGLKIANQVIDLKHTANGYRPEDRSLVRSGCDFGCSSLTCEHGGHCSVGWKDWNPASKKTTCDCSRTSYTGASCSLDEGIHFDGHSSVNFDIGTVLSKFIDKQSKFPQMFKFAFSSTNSLNPQYLAVISLENNGWFDVILNTNGSLNVGLNVGGVGQVRTFKGNFADGHRHFVVAQFHKDSATAVMVDSTREDFDFIAPSSNIDLFSALNITIGMSDNQRVKNSHYMGCLSNIVVDYQVARLNFEPLRYLDNQGHTYHEHVTIHPDQSINRIRCADFINPIAPPDQQNRVEFPVWETNFGRLVYNGPVPDGDEEQQSHGSPWWLLLVIAIIIIIAILLIVILVCRCCRKKQPEKQEFEDPEAVPLQPFTPPYQEQEKHAPTNNFDIPDPDVEMDKKPSRPSLVSLSTWKSGMTAYYTAQESFDDEVEAELEDLDETLREAEEYGEGDVPRVEAIPDHGSLLPVPAPRSPQRASSFKGSRPTPGTPMFSEPPPPRPTLTPVPSPTIPK